MSADVTIDRPKSHGSNRHHAQATAFVYAGNEGRPRDQPQSRRGDPEPHRRREPELKHDAVTVCDEHGRRYLVAGDPKLVEISKTRAREEDLSQKILEQLDWVKGVGVTVQLIPAPAPPVSVSAAAPGPSAAVEEPRSPDWQVVPNQPLELVEPEIRLDPAPHAVMAAAPPKPTDEPVIARVWVKVPRSFYYLKAFPNREPSPGELQPIVERTKELIKTAVAHASPPVS